MKNTESRVLLYDTTLRDGAQGEGVSFSFEDKLALLHKLDEAGVHCIEGGWPHPASPAEVRFFRRASRVRLKHAKLAAFGATRRAHLSAGSDPNLKALLKAGTRVVTIFGKSWDMHVREVLRTTVDENLRMVADSVRLLKKAGREVVFDAEHFFDGYRDNPEYALAVLRAAEEAGADWLVLCDTNGGTLPDRVKDAVADVCARTGRPLGMHAHNDADCAVANSLAAVSAGARMVHGTLNGFGERCGNANLCSVVPALQLKMGVKCMSEAQLRGLRGLSLFAFETATKIPRDEMPFVGASAFAHKAGVHVNAVEKNPKAYEHIDPAAVGNRRHVVVSDQAGLSAVRWKAEGFGFKFAKNDRRSRTILDELKRKSAEGYHYEGADASFELLVRKLMGRGRDWFQLADYRVSVENRGGKSSTEAALKVTVGGKAEHTVAEGDGPVNALDAALRKALARFYPEVKRVHLVDYRVRVINPDAATAAKVRVTIESTDGREVWSTVGVSENVIDASWHALADSIGYFLALRRGRTR